MKRVICVLLALSICLGLCSCGGSIAESNIAPTEVSAPVTARNGSEPIPVASASEMKLAKTVGGVHVTDDRGIEQPLIPNMNLYSGYGAGTGDGSYAWIKLDDTKLLKMDEQSRAGFQKDGRKLSVTLTEGKIFFCVLESLEEDEALEFATPNATNAVLAVRGTTGFVEVVSDHETKITLLEGEIEGTSVPGSFTLETGKLTDIIVPCKTGTHDIGEEDSGIETRDIDYEKDVPWFVIDEIQHNPDIKDKIQNNGGFVDYTPSTEHIHAYEEKVTNPECTEEGYTTCTCNCGDTYKKNYTDPLGHAWSEWETTIVPTVDSEGSAERVCAQCAKRETRVLPKVIPGHVHQYSGRVLKEPTCTTEGIQLFTCSCGDTYTESTKKDYHRYTVEIDYKSPTCFENGYYVNACQVCGLQKSQVLETSNGHYWAEWSTSMEATETSEGMAIRKCYNCDTYESRSIPKLIADHTHAYNGVVTQEPTCYSQGTTTYTCDCGDIYTEVIPMSMHPYNRTETPATCTQDGYVCSICPVCGLETWNQIIPASHSWGNWYMVKDPTQSEAGLSERRCYKCGATEALTIDPLPPSTTTPPGTVPTPPPETAPPTEAPPAEAPPTEPPAEAPPTEPPAEAPIDVPAEEPVI